ncbi:hypothetical protein M422DRAFT_257126 [Sphaerobolus stellatus SS14]|uniref:Uncharacterized protein n=1 Tax=Sphaerobolus stellatus (strain SS14) TaxID=990650 RepID=A0A0C9VQ97_SPHS4|nr:hypothetical protein M422DRAFT_257126 [Sphaerobolus stellatus SS14]
MDYSHQGSRITQNNTLMIFPWGRGYDLLSKFQQVQFLEALVILAFSPTSSAAALPASNRSLAPSYLPGDLLRMPTTNLSPPTTTKALQLRKNPLLSLLWEWRWVGWTTAAPGMSTSRPEPSEASDGTVATGMGASICRCIEGACSASTKLAASNPVDIKTTHTTPIAHALTSLQRPYTQLSLDVLQTPLNLLRRLRLLARPIQHRPQPLELRESRREQESQPQSGARKARDPHPPQTRHSLMSSPISSSSAATAPLPARHPVSTRQDEGQASAL